MTGWLALTLLGCVPDIAPNDHASNPDHDFDGDGFLPDFSFDDATGLKLEIGYSWFALSYTNIDYEVNGFSFDASNVGLRLRGGF